MSKSRAIRSDLKTRERQLQWVAWIASAALILALGVLAYAILAEYVLPLQAPIMTVTLEDGTVREIRRGEFFDRVRFERSRYRDSQDPEEQALLRVPEDFGALILERMGQELLIRDEAARRGLVVEEAEVDRYIEEAYNFYRTGVTPTVTGSAPAIFAGAAVPAATPAVFSVSEPWFESQYQDDLRTWRRYGIDESEFREIIRTQLLEVELHEAIGSEPFELLLDAGRGRWIWMDDWQEDLPKEP